MDDLLSSPDDKLTVQPPALEGVFIRALTLSLSKQMAPVVKGAIWNKKESELHQAIAELVASAKAAGLSTIQLTVERPDGSTEVRELSVEKINKTRSLQ